jgi:catechol 2,3-dioxygenase-like lactoylglutathione lyase family enzyme
LRDTAYVIDVQAIFGCQRLEVAAVEPEYAGPDRAPPDLAIAGDADTVHEFSGQPLGRGKIGKRDPVKSAMEMLRQKKIPVAKGPFAVGGGVRFLFVKDPDGVDIEFIEGAQV